MPDTIKPEEELHVTAPEDSLPPCSLEELPDIMREACARAGWTRLMPVQAHTLPYLMAGRDIMVQSRTGSGKTGAYLLPLLSLLNPEEKKPQALILAPTRELASQVEHEAAVLLEGTGLSAAALYGGVGYGRQLEALRSGVQLIVGTPGRVLDHLLRRTLSLDALRALVFDEADRMFDMGFYQDIERMFNSMRPALDRQTMLFSATLSLKVRNLAWAFMNEPVEIEVRPEEVTVKEITQELFHVTKDEKFSLLLSILNKLKAESTIIFTNTKDSAVEVAMRLKMNGYKAKYLMGDMSQSQRLETLDKFKDRKIEILVATDVAARGLQIDDLELVVNYDIPEDYENYVHRIGRTARAGKSGKAITLADETYIYGLEAIEEFIHMKIPVLWPDECGLVEVEDKSKGQKIRKNIREKDFSAKKEAKEKKKDYKKPSSSKKQAKKESAEDKLKKEINGKNVKKISLSDIAEQKRENRFIALLKRMFKR